jgi:Sortilin, neurotensin receptor 3,/Sortilin, neurotensin receptor 3, C-terminal
VSLEHVNGNKDHEIAYYRMPGVDGVARVNILTNPNEAVYTGKKKLQTRITHDDGGSWHPLKPPSRDSNRALYPCDDNTKCALHLHGPKYAFDFGKLQHDSTTTGLMLAVGNVGEFLAPREESDMFLTRNAGITWEEVHKDAHLWAFGDSGSILVIANDEQPTDRVQYTTDHGLHWTEYNFGIELRVETLTSDPGGRSRKFILTGWNPAAPGAEWPSTVVYLNFAELNPRQCRPYQAGDDFMLNTSVGVPDGKDPVHSDFEVWHPSEDRGECLLGAKVGHSLYTHLSNT